MALTQSARVLPGPSWDEEVVPALRSRLEKESRTLAHRMSVTSMGSNEDLNWTYYDPTTSTARKSSSSSSKTSTQRQHKQQQPTQVYQQPEPVVTPHTPRARTYSSPRINGVTSPDPSRSTSTSPMSAELKPTRIPQPARRRADSTSSQAYYLTGPSATSPPPPPLPNTTNNNNELYAVHELHGASSQSTLSVNHNITRQRSGILNEQPPFPPPSTISSSHAPDEYYPDEAPPRPSTESEERPYEHWYRGEVSRNGGVGELRVAKRMEMLEIANFGHQPRTRERRPNTKDSNSSGKYAYMEAINERRRIQKKRAGSLGPEHTERESFYLDDERAKEVARVLDEGPLTDHEVEEYEEYEYEEPAGAAASSSSYDLRSVTPTMHDYERSATPTANGRLAASPPPKMTRGASEPPFPVSTSSAQSTPRKNISASTSTPKSQQSKRGQSPVPLSASKKARTEASKATRAKMEAARKQAEKERRSVGQYPTAHIDNSHDVSMEDAIPQWTQPVPNGNWDDVVLPVVARKKGLDSQYQNADGSPKQPQKQEAPIAPAPGTFGYDYSKYRPPRDNFNSIPMDEFGRPSQQSSSQQQQQQQGSTTSDEFDPYSNRPNPPMSQSAFDETPVGLRRDGPLQPGAVDLGREGKLHPVSEHATKLQMDLTAQQQQQLEEKEESAGCCKCTIM